MTAMTNSAVLTFSQTPEDCTGDPALYLKWSGDPQNVGIILRIAQEFILKEMNALQKLRILAKILNNFYFKDIAFIPSDNFINAATLHSLTVENFASEGSWTRTENGIYILRDNWEAELQLVSYSNETLGTRLDHQRLKQFREEIPTDRLGLYQRTRQRLINESYKSLGVSTQPTVDVSPEQSKAIITDRYGDVW